MITSSTVLGCKPEVGALGNWEAPVEWPVEIGSAEEAEVAAGTETGTVVELAVAEEVPVAEVVPAILLSASVP